ncbi:MAG: short chain dehydrogenase [Gammaproteobacteria bacterium]|nr:MAG: short chain dehydrogenase [Gammaproteobacteria bacterium]
MNIKGKTILLTGASGGIGQAIAIRLHKHQAKLILVGRNFKKLEAVNEMIGNNHQIICADLSQTDGRNKLVSYCESLTHIDILINNAGVSHFSTFESSSDDQINQLMNINLLSPMLLTKALLPMLARPQNSIILNVGSSFGTIGYPCFTTYCASKFGLKGFSESLKRELQNKSTKVLYIAPRATDTDINSTSVNQLNKKLGNATDTVSVVADVVIKQLLNETERVAIGWPEKLFLKVNGLIPSIVDKAIGNQIKQIMHFAKLSNIGSVVKLTNKSTQQKTMSRITSSATHS